MKLRDVRAPEELNPFLDPLPGLDDQVGCLHCCEVHLMGDYTVRRGLILCPDPECDGSLLDVVVRPEDVAVLRGWAHRA